MKESIGEQFREVANRKAEVDAEQTTVLEERNQIQDQINRYRDEKSAVDVSGIGLLGIDHLILVPIGTHLQRDRPANTERAERNALAGQTRQTACRY